MGAVVADRPVARVAILQRVAFGVGVGEPREVLADLRGVGAARLVGQRRLRERRRVLVEDRGEGPDRATAMRPRRGSAAALVFSEAVSEGCRARGCVFSEVIPGGYIRERSSLKYRGGQPVACRATLICCNAA